MAGIQRFDKILLIQSLIHCFRLRKFICWDIKEIVAKLSLKKFEDSRHLFRTFKEFNFAYTIQKRSITVTLQTFV